MSITFTRPLVRSTETKYTSPLVAALFENPSDAERAVRALCQSGYVIGKIGAIVPSRTETRIAIERTAFGRQGSQAATRLIQMLGQNKVAELWTRGLGQLMIAGALVPMLATPMSYPSAWQKDGCVGAELTVGLVRAGLDKTEANFVKQGLCAGRILIAVNGFSRNNNAGGILRKLGGQASQLGKLFVKDYGIPQTINALA